MVEQLAVDWQLLSEMIIEKSGEFRETLKGNPEPRS